MRIYVGIDPGLNGGIAFLDRDANIVKVYPMPTLDKLLDVRATSLVLSGLWREGTPFKSDKQGEIAHVFIEQVGAMPQQGSVSMFTFGRVYGVLEGLVAGFRYPYTLVRPREWQKAMHAGVEGKVEDPKKRSLVAIQRLYPKADFRRSERAKVAHDGIVDAVLIARHGISVSP